VVAVRPDGHVGFAAADAGDVALRGWLHRAGLPTADREDLHGTRAAPV
jgi:hypothetical protein